jgi:hypothetical protein
VLAVIAPAIAPMTGTVSASAHRDDYAMSACSYAPNMSSNMTPNVPKSPSTPPAGEPVQQQQE